MTFEQLDYFIAAVQCDTFLDAAETLHISQSALSKHIMKLEKELDIQLWDRSRRSAVLTEAGHMFYEEALNLSKEYRRTLFRISEFKEKAGQRLSIGTLPILSQYHLTAMLKDFADSHPLIHVFLEEVEEHDLLQGFPTTPMTSSSPAATCWTVKPIPSFHWQKTGWLQSCLKTTDWQTDPASP